MKKENAGSSIPLCFGRNDKLAAPDEAHNSKAPRRTIAGPFPGMNVRNIRQIKLKVYRKFTLLLFPQKTVENWSILSDNRHTLTH